MNKITLRFLKGRHLLGHYLPTIMIIVTFRRKVGTLDYEPCSEEWRVEVVLNRR